MALGLGSMFVTLLGLWVARLNLMHYFSDKATAVALLSMAFASTTLP
jgi:hypothetical protein